MKQLQALEAVARYGSFTLAAKHLRISQPSVSSLINGLERQFKCKMFYRTGNTVEPTALLEEVLGKVNAIVRLRDELEQQLTLKKDLNVGRLNVGYTTYQVAMPILADFANQFPGVEVTARAMATNDLMPLLGTGDFDIAFVSGNQPPAELHAVPIAPTRIGIIVPEDHALVGKSDLSWSDIEGLKLLQREPSSATRRTFDSAAKIAGAYPDTLMSLGSWGSIMALVRSGLGVGVGFQREFTDEAGLVFLPINDRNLHITQYLVCLPAMQETSTVAEFLRIAEKHL